jgi:hypothetical protein
MPAPPAALARRNVILTEFEGVLFRSHRIKRNPIHYGTSRIHRFDSPNGSYGVPYAGRVAYCAFIETFARSAGVRIVTTAELEARALSELKATRPLNSIDLTQSGALARIGADARLFAGDHSIAHLWSNALHEYPAEAMVSSTRAASTRSNTPSCCTRISIESHSVAPRKPPARARQEEMF